MNIEHILFVFQKDLFVYLGRKSTCLRAWVGGGAEGAGRERRREADSPLSTESSVGLPWDHDLSPNSELVA